VYVNDLSEQQIINDFFILLDEDNKVFQFKHLNVNEYKILKNPLLGTINVTFFLKENQFDFILEGFKKYPIRIETIDGSVCETNLIGSDVNTTMVKKMIELNGFHKYLSEILDFSLTNIDDEKGKITVKITRCDDLYLRPHYLNSSFSIKNLKSYYLKQNNNIDEYFLKKKPSEITLSDFKENFITMSSEFKNRNSENLIIKLKSDDGSNRLTANISYIDSKTKNEKTMTMVFENFKKNNSVVITILIVLICLAGVSVLGFIA
jgi:hypothetical protein